MIDDPPWWPAWAPIVGHLGGIEDLRVARAFDPFTDGDEVQTWLGRGLVALGERGREIVNQRLSYEERNTYAAEIAAVCEPAKPRYVAGYNFFVLEVARAQVRTGKVTPWSQTVVWGCATEPVVWELPT